MHRARTQLREHDDREQFLAGIDLILAGIETVNRAGKDSLPGRSQGLTGNCPSCPAKRTDPPHAHRPLRPAP